MTIDKSWTKCRNRRSNEFVIGLNAFLERCKDHLNSQDVCCCPCEKCGNQKWGTLNDLSAHIQRWGVSTGYKTWWYHGEQVAPPVVHATRDEMVDVLNDVRLENTGNEHNTYMPGPSNESAEEDSGATSEDIDDLYALANTEVYPGCTWVSTLDFVAKLSHMKVMNNWTNSSFEQLLEFWKYVLPNGSKVPSSHYEAKKMMKKVGLGYEPIHACKNDCCLFWKENKDKQSFPTYHESRWKDKDTTGKKVANKVLHYFPLTPRLKRMYSSRHTAKSMTWHASGRCKEDGKMRHPVDGKSWKDFDERFPEFAREPRNVRLGLAADAFNPHGNMSLSYGTWPVIMTTYNTPPWLCMKESFFMLTLLIPGPKSPGKDN